MEYLSSDDDGIPEIIDASVNSTSNVQKIDHKKKRKPSKAFSVDVDEVESFQETVPVPLRPPTNNPNDHFHPPENQFYQQCGESKAVFTIAGVGYDVILSEKHGKISWSEMNASGKYR